MRLRINILGDSVSAFYNDQVIDLGRDDFVLGLLTPWHKTGGRFRASTSAEITVVTSDEEILGTPTDRQQSRIRHAKVRIEECLRKAIGMTPSQSLKEMLKQADIDAVTFRNAVSSDDPMTIQHALLLYDDQMFRAYQLPICDVTDAIENMRREYDAMFGFGVRKLVQKGSHHTIVKVLAQKRRQIQESIALEELASRLFSGLDGALIGILENKLQKDVASYKLGIESSSVINQEPKPETTSTETRTDSERGPISERTLLSIPIRNWNPNFGPAALLRADLRVVPFRGRDTEMDNLLDWANSPAPFAARLYIGPGGRGKTRFAIEACLQLKECGMPSGFARLDTLEDIERLLGASDRNDRFLVIDYAEHRRDLAERLIRSAAQCAGRRIRIMLLARMDLSSWWLKIVHSPALKDHLRGSDRVKLDSLIKTSEDQGKRFKEALDAFAMALKCPLPKPLPEADMATDYASILYLHMAALMALREPAGDLMYSEAAIFQNALDRERAFWANLVEAHGLSEHLVEGVGLALANITEKGGVATQYEAVERLEALPFFRGQTGEVLYTVARMLHDSYGGDNKWIEPLQPDLFGEYLQNTVDEAQGLDKARS